LRRRLNADLETLARIYNERATDAAELGDQGRYASWYLLVLGFGAMVFASLNVLVVKTSVVGPLAEITQATDRIANGNLDCEIPHYSRTDEIGRLALAVAVHEDITGPRQHQRILERTEQFLVTVVENIPEGIVVKDARSLRYVFVNKAAEEMIGMSRAEIMGKTARELFPVEAAELIERRDRELMERKQQTEAIVDIVDNPVRGRRTIAVRRLQVGGPDRESHLFVSMVQDRTGQPDVAS